MTLELRPAEPLDAGALGEILHGFETDTPWMPDLHSGAEAVAFCDRMIARGWVIVAETLPVADATSANPNQAMKRSAGSGGAGLGAAAPSPAPPLRPRPDADVAVRIRPGIVGFMARDKDEILALYVRRGWEGRGIGPALLSDAKARCDRLELWTFQANQGAQRFYRREGFVETARSDGADTEEGLPDVQFSWSAEAI